ncbi:hypothetical protein [Micromonospora sp. NPDC005197]|uniref:hypothetical protein n=1 Tax=Micromonospora sp. NPDC005197 TaxID=3157020 RepID=UPI0033AF663B
MALTHNVTAPAAAFQAAAAAVEALPQQEGSRDAMTALSQAVAALKREIDAVMHEAGQAHARRPYIAPVE